jgi:hypothetical protein
MACKFEEILFYDTALFVKNSENEMITKESILEMEMDILEALEYKTIYIGPLDILKRLTLITKYNKKVGK